MVLHIDARPFFFSGCGIPDIRTQTAIPSGSLEVLNKKPSLGRWSMTDFLLSAVSVCV